jgi:hypothetical protein
MNSRIVLASCLLWVGAAAAYGQDPAAAGAPPAFAPDEVVAVIEGKEYTAAEVERIRSAMPPGLLEQTAGMDYKGFLEALAMQIKLSSLAEERQLAEKEPYRTQLEINKRIFLAGAYLREIQQVLDITEEDRRNYYEQHKSDYTDVRVSAIYTDYVLDPEKAEPRADGKKALSEQEAWARSEQLLVDLRQGADFAELARKQSDDAASAEKGGDLGSFNASSRIPEAIKKAIFALEEGAVSAPVKQGGRYYIFKATEKRVKPLDEVVGDILVKLQGVKIQEKLDEIRTQVQIEIKNEAFAKSKPPSRRTQPPPGAAPAPGR